METFSSVVGHRLDDAISENVHRHEHAGNVVLLRVPAKELGRRRFKAKDQHGVEYGVALRREAPLQTGTVLELTEQRAVIIDAQESEELKLRATSVEGGVQLGWHAGHLHWRIRGSGDTVIVLLDGPREEYLTRITTFIQRGLIEITG